MSKYAPLTKKRLDKLLVNVGHAINANNGRCGLIEGKDGKSQPTSIKRHLKSWEDAGLIVYRTDGWYFTEAGTRKCSALRVEVRIHS